MGLPKPRTVIPAVLRGRNRFLIRDHFRAWALFPERQMPGQKSEYVDKTSRWRKKLQKIPGPVWKVLDPVLFLGLRATRRNALVFEQNGQVNAHVIFQRHNDALHMFSVWVHPSKRGKGYSFSAVKEFISFARAQRGIRRVRIGGGNDPAVNRVFGKFAERAHEYGLSPRRGNWLDFAN